MELLIAMMLLGLMFTIIGSVYSNAVSAAGMSQSSCEMSAATITFAQQIRQDISSLENGGFLAMGRRSQSGYGSARDRSAGRAQPFRTDWMEYILNTEQRSSGDGRVVGQTSRVFVGHGPVTGPTPSSSLATDWVLFRCVYIQLPYNRVSTVTADSSKGYECGTGDFWTMPGTRRFRWWGLSSTPSWIFEPGFYFAAGSTWDDEYAGTGAGTYSLKGTQWGIGSPFLPYCGEFCVQYAMASDVTTGVINWRDPPGQGSTVADPNYRAYKPTDPCHPQPSVTNGRLVFGPGDEWPVLLRVQATVFDPAQRLPGGRSLSVIIPVH